MHKAVGWIKIRWIESYQKEWNEKNSTLSALSVINTYSFCFCFPLKTCKSRTHSVTKPGSGSESGSE